MGRKNYDNIQQLSWKEHPIGAVIKEPGSSRLFKTGGWRTFRPIRDEEKCNDCLICFVFCPDSALSSEEEKISGPKLDFCKGCGICAEVCPRQAIEMIDEMEAEKKFGDNSS